MGGAAGVYALPLAERGYEVHLVDPLPRHVEQAREVGIARADNPLASATVGDARRLSFDDASFDGVLMLGPLYHLTDRDDRLAALREGLRILTDEGCLFAAAISRFASTYDGLTQGFLNDDAFRRIVERDLDEGQHRNPTDHPNYFTTAYFHLPDELGDELRLSGLSLEGVFAVEGPGSWLVDCDQWLRDPGRREILLAAIRRVEREPALLGASSHLLVIGRRA